MLRKSIRRVTGHQKLQNKREQHVKNGGSSASGGAQDKVENGDDGGKKKGNFKTFSYGNETSTI